MIGRIRGQVLEVCENHALIDVAGVAYELEVTSAALAELPGNPAEVVLYTHFVVREDAQLLYGFASRAERDVFRDLIRINGIGPKLALKIVSCLSLEQLVDCVRGNDIGLLTRVPGVGKKTAERLLVELKDRLSTLPLPVRPSPVAHARLAVSEAEDALVALGYKPHEARRAVASVAGEADSTEALLRAALRQIARLVEVAS